MAAPSWQISSGGKNPVKPATCAPSDGGVFILQSLFSAIFSPDAHFQPGRYAISRLNPWQESPHMCAADLLSLRPLSAIKRR